MEAANKQRAISGESSLALSTSISSSMDCGESAGLEQKKAGDAPETSGQNVTTPPLSNEQSTACHSGGNLQLEDRRPDSLRQDVADLMVCRHHIPPKLADDHVRQMDQEEIEWRFVELYVALSEYDDRSEQERAAWAKELIHKAREVPTGEQAPLPLEPDSAPLKQGSSQ
jgi:hypothetical protein